MLEYISLIFLLLGICALIIGIYYFNRINSVVSSFRISWRILLHILLFFLVGYLLGIVLLIKERPTLITFLLSIVLLAVSIFIALAGNLSDKTIAKLRKLILVESENIQMKMVQRRLQAILDHTAEGIITFDETGVILHANKAAEKLFGFVGNELLGKRVQMLIKDADKELLNKIDFMAGKEHHLTGISKKGKELLISLKASKMVLNGEKHYTCIISDISEKQQMLEQLHHLADHDSLTGLYNRRYFTQRLEESLQLVKRDALKCTLLYVDLDNFKDVNDEFGHPDGDKILIAVAKLLQKNRRTSDCVARFGGDEFLILLFNTDKDSGLKVAEQIRDAFAENVFKNGRNNLQINCSIGAYAISKGCDNADAAIANADSACYAAKKAGKNSVHQFT